MTSKIGIIIKIAKLNDSNFAIFFSPNSQAQENMTKVLPLLLILSYKLRHIIILLHIVCVLNCFAQFPALDY